MAVKVEGGKVRYAVVGAGWISQAAFMPGVEHTGNSELTAIITGDARKAEALGKRYGVTRAFHYDAFRPALESGGFDALYIATPNWRHREFAVPALEAGFHVLLEKPTATSVEDSEAIEAAAKQGGGKLMVAYRLHFEPGTLEALRLVQGGAIGEAGLFTSVFAQHVAATNHRAQNGFWAGPVPDMGAYPINAVRNLFRAEPVEVMAWGRRTGGYDFDNVVAAQLRFADGRLAQFTVAYGLNEISEYRVTGTKGDLVVSQAFNFPGPLQHSLTVGESTTATTFPAIDQFGSETRYFSDCILQDRDPEPDGEEGTLDMRVICAIERALLTGRTQALAPLHRSKHPQQEQRSDLPPVRPPALVHAAEPGKG